jgi:hypothetical protein
MKMVVQRPFVAIGNDIEDDPAAMLQFTVDPRTRTVEQILAVGANLIAPAAFMDSGNVDILNTAVKSSASSAFRIHRGGPQPGPRVCLHFAIALQNPDKR